MLIYIYTVLCKEKDVVGAMKKSLFRNLQGWIWNR